MGFFLRGRVVLLAILCIGAGFTRLGHAVGITADAGMTPPVDRWMARGQTRYMKRGGKAGMRRGMTTLMNPLMLAYGLLPRMTVIARQPLMHRRMKMVASSRTDTGFGDFSFLSKYSILRVNRPEFIFAISPMLGIELPTGDKDFGSNTWDILSGVYVSARRGPLGADLNFEYRRNRVGRRRATRPGDEITLNLATAYQFTLNDAATLSLWPVLETSYTHSNPNWTTTGRVADSGEDAVLVSPGIKIAYQSFILEMLLQIPAYQRQRGSQLEREVGGILGVRYMF